jgi:hypothetical protein
VSEEVESVLLGDVLRRLDLVGRQLSDLDGGVRSVQAIVSHHHGVLERQDLALERHEAVIARRDVSLDASLSSIEGQLLDLSSSMEVLRSDALAHGEVVVRLHSELRRVVALVELVHLQTFSRLDELRLALESKSDLSDTSTRRLSAG